MSLLTKHNYELGGWSAKFGKERRKQRHPCECIRLSQDQSADRWTEITYFEFPFLSSAKVSWPSGNKLQWTTLAVQN